jgi:hypothetical protein
MHGIPPLDDLIGWPAMKRVCTLTFAVRPWGARAPHTDPQPTHHTGYQRERQQGCSLQQCARHGMKPGRFDVQGRALWAALNGRQQSTSQHASVNSTRAFISCIQLQCRGITGPAPGGCWRASVALRFVPIISRRVGTNLTATAPQQCLACSGSASTQPSPWLLGPSPPTSLASKVTCSWCKK